MPVPSLTTQLPWQSLAAGGNALAGLGSDPGAALAGLGQSYNQQYQAALGLNQKLFEGTQAGYEALRNDVSNQYNNVVQGYRDLSGDVLSKIAGTNSSNIQDINTQYDYNKGAAKQQMISGGLGNSTIQQGLNRAIELDRARAITGSQNQFAQLQAGYQSQLGQAGLGAQQQGIGLGANLGQAQLGMLERVNAGYPDAGMYGSLAQMYGAQQQNAKNEKMIAAGLGNAARGQMSTPGTSSPSSPFGSRPLNTDPFGFGSPATASGSFGGGGGGTMGGGSSGAKPGFNYGTGGYGGSLYTPPASQGGSALGALAGGLGIGNSYLNSDPFADYNAYYGITDNSDPFADYNDYYGISDYADPFADYNDYYGISDNTDPYADYNDYYGITDNTDPFAAYNESYSQPDLNSMQGWEDDYSDNYDWWE